MIEQKYSVTRTRATWKPRIADDDLPFYRCPECGRVLQGIAGSLPGIVFGRPAQSDGRAPLCARHAGPPDMLRERA